MCTYVMKMELKALFDSEIKLLLPLLSNSSMMDADLILATT